MAFFFNIMKNFFLLILIFFVSNNILSQVSRSIEAESSVVTNHFVTVNGTRIPYSATAGTLPVWSEDDNAFATLFYTYYKNYYDNCDNAQSIILFFFDSNIL